VNIPRIIPCLLLAEGGLHKTRRFAASRYVGDPINAVRIFNEKEVDEIIVLRTDLQHSGGGPPFAQIADLASECFMPLAYGGGVRSLEEMDTLFRIGVEKVVLNTAAIETPELVRAAALRFGSQAVVVACDAKRRTFGGARVYAHRTRRTRDETPVDFCRRMQALGAGEILLNAVDRDGMQTGYDVPLLKEVTAALEIPVIASGGAGSLEDLRRAIREGAAAAAAAGSLFVFQGRHRAVLITYPERAELERLFAPAAGDAP
jgi:cyclase